MLSASKSLTPTRHNLSTPLLHYLIGRRTSDRGANLQKLSLQRRFVHYAAPARLPGPARRSTQINLLRALHTPSAATGRTRIDTGDKMADVETILAGKYPAKAHAKRVVEYIRKKNPNATGTLYLEGQKTRMIEDNDGEAPFR